MHPRLSAETMASFALAASARNCSSLARRACSARWRSVMSCARDRKSTRLNSSHGYISYAVFCLKKKKKSNDYEPEKNFSFTHVNAHEFVQFNWYISAVAPELMLYIVASVRRCFRNCLASTTVT